MKRVITTAEQRRINQLLDLRKQRQEKKVITKSDARDRLVQYEMDNKVAKNGMTYKQLEDLNRLA